MMQRPILAAASSALVILMAAGALKVRYVVASRHYAIAQKVQGRDQVLHLEKALDLEPGLDNARLELASDLMSLGHYDRALTQLGQLLHHRQDSPAQTTLLRRLQGESLYHLNRYPDAAMALQRALRITPTDSQSHLLLGRTYENLRQTSDAEAEYRAAIQADPNGEDAYIDLATLLLDSGKSAQADQLGALMSAKPLLAMDWYRVQANHASRTGQPSGVLWELRLAALADPSSPRPHQEAATFLLKWRQPAEAVKEAEKAVAAAPDDPQTRLLLAQCLEAAQQWTEAVALLQSVEKEHPEAFGAWVAAGKGPRSDNPEAVLWQEHLEMVINPGDLRLMGPEGEPGIQQAWYLGDSGAHHVDPRLANSLFLQGALAQSRHDYTGAGQFYQNALHFIPVAESPENTLFTNRLRQAIEASIDAVIQTQISGKPVPL